MNVLRRQITVLCMAVTLSVASGTVCLAAAEDHGPYSVKEDLSLWGIIAFVGFLIAVKALGWDSLTGGMKAREEKEVQLLNEAEQLRAASQAELQKQKGQIEALDEEIREALVEADRDADHTRNDIRATADREARTARSRAEVEVARVKDQTLHDLFEAMAERVTNAAEQRIREKLSEQDQQELVEAAVNQFATSGK